MKRYLIFVLALLLLPIPAFAEREPTAYVFASLGRCHINGPGPTQAMKDIMGTADVSSTYSSEGDSTYSTLGIGHEITENVSFEIFYMDGVHISDHFTINDIKGVPVNISLSRRAELSAVNASVVSKYSLSRRFDVFARVGVYEYRIKMIQKLSFPNSQGIFLGQEDTDTGVDLMGSLGANINLSRPCGLRVEIQRAGRVEAYTAGFTCSIHFS